MPAQTRNSMGRKTGAEELQALLLSNCTLRYLVLMAVAHIVRAMDGRFLDHLFFFSIEKERPWQRLLPASELILSEFFIFNLKLFTSIAPAENSSESGKV